MNTKLDLAAHIAALRAKEAAAPTATADNCILFWGTLADKNYLPQLKGCVGSATTFVRLETVSTLAQVTMHCHAKGITRVISTSLELLKKLLHWDKRKAPSLDNYSGSYFRVPGFKPESPEIEIVFIAPLKQLITVTYARSVVTRLIAKLTEPKKWYKPTTFSGFEVLTASNEAMTFSVFSQAKLISIDIETFRENATIRCLSYTAFFYETSRGWMSKSVVLPMDSEYSLAIMRKWNWELKAPKVFQNGKYDISYFCRYSAPVYAYLYDTANLFHSWYSELPKDLGFLNAYFIREAVYWKDLAETNDLYEYYRYNALDTWGTGNAFLAMILEAPAYAINNYLLEFPLVFPCHLAEMTGIARDMSKLDEAKAEQDKIIDTATASLNKILSVPTGESFNTNSPLQMKALLKILGCSDLKSADATNLKKARFRHPLNARIISLILTVRKARKLVSTYITPGKEFSPLLPRAYEPAPRILFSLNPHGTDSSRLASREHHFWCGLQVQNIPRGPEVKCTLKADPGFLLVEVDLAQAESRDTAYISGDANLIQNVEYSPDFHCANASAFFGVPFEELFDVATGKVLNKPLRQIGKPVNHGANYNMGAYILIETMGEEMVGLARKLLGLPVYWSYMQVAEYLLEQFHKTYPGIKGTFYPGVVAEILKTRMLTSMAVHHSWQNCNNSLPLFKELANKSYESDLAANPSWVRYCFGAPDKNKHHLNSYISHPPQSLNAQTLNKSYLSVFQDIAINPKHSNNFKLLPQIHDSILMQVRIGHEYLADMVKERMEIPVTIKAYDGKVRTFVVPAEASNLGTYWSDLK